MTTEHVTPQEEQRLAAVHHYDIIDTPREAAFDRTAALAARLLDAPAAAVSVLGADRTWFKAVHGLDGLAETSRQFRGRAVDGVPAVLDAAQEAEHPLVREHGFRAHAAAPITTPGGHRIGTVEVLDTRPRRFGESDLAGLRDVAAVVMDELEYRLRARTTQRCERDLRQQAEQDKATIAEFASTLQRSLLPPALPEVPGAELAAHYHAASPAEVTGDFYDVFALGDGRWAFCLGDVTGHGAAAATVTCQVRYTLRASALHRADPADVLADLNEVLRGDPHVPQCCTLLFGIIRPDPRGGVDITLAGGGHPPPLRVTAATGEVEEVATQGGMLVGVLSEPAFATCCTNLVPGQVLLLYTDGLTEARPGGRFFGEDGLKEHLAAHPRASPREQIAVLTELVESFDPAPSDDVALLALSAA